MKYIYIPDIKLKKAVNEELVKLLGKREMLQDITDDEILNITSLYIDSCGINDLTGLRYAKNLNYINFPYNNISDICRSDTMRICELREKEVINTCDCKVLGCVVDIDFDLCSGQIEAIIVPGPGKVCGIFGVDSEYIIPFACIRKIGPDIILVEIQKEKFLKKI